MKLLNLSLITIMAILFIGCTSNVKQSLGIQKDIPNEGMVATQPALVLPPDYNLRPPADQRISPNLSNGEKALLGKIERHTETPIDKKTPEKHHLFQNDKLNKEKNSFARDSAMDDTLIKTPVNNQVIKEMQQAKNREICSIKNGTVQYCSSPIFTKAISVDMPGSSKQK